MIAFKKYKKWIFVALIGGGTYCLFAFLFGTYGCNVFPEYSGSQLESQYTLDMPVNKSGVPGTNDLLIKLFGKDATVTYHRANFNTSAGVALTSTGSDVLSLYDGYSIIFEINCLNSDTFTNNRIKSSTDFMEMPYCGRIIEDYSRYIIVPYCGKVIVVENGKETNRVGNIDTLWRWESDGTVWSRVDEHTIKVLKWRREITNSPEKIISLPQYINTSSPEVRTTDMILPFPINSSHKLPFETNTMVYMDGKFVIQYGYDNLSWRVDIIKNGRKVKSMVRMWPVAQLIRPDKQRETARATYLVHRFIACSPSPDFKCVYVDVVGSIGTYHLCFNVE